MSMIRGEVQQVRGASRLGSAAEKLNPIEP
jgi:hypothetical protein